MTIYTTTKALQKKLFSLPIESSIGFVPTMGALHRGHISLVEKALQDNSHVVVSIFVNPTQFDNKNDLVKYPRNIDEDTALLKNLGDSVIVFAPSAEEVYSEKVKAKKYNFGRLADEMEGQHRKGHFNGVGTVLTHLFRIIEPSKAYFGEKDYQQLQIVRKLVLLENMPVQIIGCPILRESNGLAMSSRNERLTDAQRNEAVFISEILKQTRENFSKKSIPALKRAAKKAFDENPHLELEYFEIANSETLTSAKRKQKGVSFRAFVAAFAGDVRLIDNMAVN